LSAWTKYKTKKYCHPGHNKINLKNKKERKKKRNLFTSFQVSKPKTKKNKSNHFLLYKTKIVILDK
jgi:hypothetical protein